MPFHPARLNGHNYIHIYIHYIYSMGNDDIYIYFTHITCFFSYLWNLIHGFLLVLYLCISSPATTLQSPFPTRYILTCPVLKYPSSHRRVTNACPRKPTVSGTAFYVFLFPFHLTLVVKILYTRLRFLSPPLLLNTVMLFIGNTVAFVCFCLN